MWCDCQWDNYPPEFKCSGCKKSYIGNRTAFQNPYSQLQKGHHALCEKNSNEKTNGLFYKKTNMTHMYTTTKIELHAPDLGKVHYESARGRV